MLLTVVIATRSLEELRLFNAHGYYMITAIRKGHLAKQVTAFEPKWIVTVGVRDK
jgi:hypothetical protein